MRDRPHLVLMGLMGAGKSTVGSMVATALGQPYHDSDTTIQELFGRSGAELAAREGVRFLHRIEEMALLADLAPPDVSVITAAASTTESMRCQAALADRAVVAWLDLPVEIAIERAVLGTHRRLVSPADVAELHARRAPLFRQIADRRFDATRASDGIAEEIVAWVQAGP